MEEHHTCVYDWQCCSRGIRIFTQNLGEILVSGLIHIRQSISATTTWYYTLEEPFRDACKYCRGAIATCFYCDSSCVRCYDHRWLNVFFYTRI